MGVLLADVERRVLIPHQRALLEEVAQGVVVKLGADIAYVQPGLVRGPGRVDPGPLLAVGLGCVDSPKQLQPVALCLRIDGGSPLELIRSCEHLTLPSGAPGSDANFRERRLGEVHRICLSRTLVNKAPNLLL